VPLWPASTEELVASGPGEPTARVCERVARARMRQHDRLHGTRWVTNAEIPASDGAMERLCPLAPDAARLLAQLARARKLSPRAQHRLRRVARTIGDLRRPGDDLDGPIRTEDVAEAAQLRRLPEMREG
jgi:magnesium chelatase family protein